MSLSAVSTSHPLTRTLPARLAAWFGVLAAAVLLVNAAKRSGALPTSAWTQLIAPGAEVFAIFFVIGVAVVSRMRGTFATVFTSLNIAALAALVAAEAVINLVFTELSSTQIDELRSGSLGVFLTIASVAFLLGSIGFAVSCALAPNRPPMLALVGYGVASVPISLRAFVPEFALNVGLVVLAASIVTLSVWMLREPSTP